MWSLESVLARPKLEGSQSRSDLIIELAVREKLTVREILSRLGLFREEYAGTTLREHYGLPVPPNQFHSAAARLARGAENQ